MTHHLVLGAGGVGRSTAAHLVARGHTVTLASRSGVLRDRPWEARPGGHDAVEVVAADASDPSALVRLAQGAASIVNAINPPSYTTWARDWPPVAAAVLAAAERRARASSPSATSTCTERWTPRCARTARCARRVTRV